MSPISTVETSKVQPDGFVNERVVQRSGSRCLFVLPLSVALAILAGCSQVPQRVTMPEFEPEAVTARAFEALDSNGDAALTRDELAASAGLTSSLSIFDGDGDQRISRQELTTQLRNWREEKSGLISVECEVTWQGRPLEGATIRLIPEPYFGGAIAAASAQTDQSGHAELSCDKEHLPEALKNLRAVQPGIYRVEVTHPEIALPAEFNTDTRLGRSVSLRNANTLVLNL